jgi:hypothetical protein
VSACCRGAKTLEKIFCREQSQKYETRLATSEHCKKYFIQILVLRCLYGYETHIHFCSINRWRGDCASKFGVGINTTTIASRFCSLLKRNTLPGRKPRCFIRDLK